MMKGDIRIQKCKGAHDLSPEEMKRFRLVEDAFRDCCCRSGYAEVRTPTIEYLYLFTSAGTLTPSMLGKVYSFLDWDGWSGERVVLRPDGTIPVARYYIENIKGNKVARLFYITNMFIFEPTGAERREKWQGGVELIGASSPIADVELIVLAFEVLERLGLKDTELVISHAGLIRALLGSAGIEPKEQTELFDRVLDGEATALAGIKAKRPEIERVLSLLLDTKGESSGFLKNVKSLANEHLPEFEHYLNDLISIVELIQALGYRYKVDIASGRGFEYYTGIIYQLFQNGEKIGGGGRYDDIIPLLGQKDVPGSGFALYIDSLMNLIKTDAVVSPLSIKILVRAGSSEVKVMKESFNMVDSLREAGYTAEIGLGNEKVDDFRWTLDVRSDPMPFILNDSVRQKKIEVKTAGEVLTFLGEEDGDKDSIA